jgi:hypothetical protein
MMMTPQEKAKQLYGKYYGIPLYIKTVKQCCHIAVDEILNVTVGLTDFTDDFDYWQEVKEEIDKL